MNTGMVGDEDVQWGPASSPIIHGPLVIVQNDRQRESFLAAYELDSGEQVWKVDRDEFPSWATPLVMTTGGQSELVVNASKFIRGYDPMTGRELWRLPDAETQVKVPSPVAGAGAAIVTGGYPRGLSADLRDQPRQQGDDRLGGHRRPSSGAAIAARPTCRRRSSTGVSCTCWPTTACCRRSTSRQARGSTSSGSTRRRLASARRPSPPAVTSTWPARTATSSSSRPGKTFELVARNDMNEPLMATPAVAEGHAHHPRPLASVWDWVASSITETRRHEDARRPYLVRRRGMAVARS